jgi:hypothetical protein
MSSAFQNNLNTAIIASNNYVPQYNYVPQSLKPEIQGGDTCRKIIPTKFGDEKLIANTSGNSTDFNMKKIVNRRERPYIPKRRNPPGEERIGTKTRKSRCWRWWPPGFYECEKSYTFKYYHWFKPYYVPDNPRYFCKYEGTKKDNKLNLLGRNLGKQTGIKRGLEKGFKYIVEDNRGNWYGINSNYLFNQNNKYNSGECYDNNVHITNVYEISDKIAKDCADMVTSINNAASSNDMTSALQNKLYIDIQRANSMLTPKQSNLPAEAEVLENFECNEENEQSNVAPQVKNIVCDMNNQIKTLAQGYDFRARYANNQRSILKNSFTSNEIFDKKIDKNVQKLDSIANEIMVKDRLIKFNKEKLKENELTEKLLRGFFATFVLLTIPVVLYFTNVISLRVLFALVLAYFIGYFIYMGVMIRKNKLKKFFKPVFKEMSDYEKAARNYVKKEKNRISKELSEFAYGQCNCPPAEEERPELPDADVPFTENEYELENNDGYFYNDGTAPPQRMVPKVHNLPGDPEKFNIDWEVNRQMGVTKSSDGTAVPNWYNIGLPVLSDSMQRILTKCQSPDKEIVVTDNDFIRGIYYLIKKEEPTPQIVNGLKNRFLVSQGIIPGNMVSEEESVQIPNFNLNSVRKSFFDWLLASENISEKQFMRDLYNRTGDKQADYKNNILISLYVALLKEKTLTIGL